MNILHLMQCTNLGGMEQEMYTLMRALHGGEYNFTVIALHPLGMGKEILDEIDVPAMGCPYRGKFGLLSHHLYRREVNKHQPDLVLVTGPSLGNCWAASSFHVPKLLTVHSHHGQSTWDILRWRSFYRFFTPIFDRILFDTNFILKEAVNIYPPLRAKSFTFPTPVRIPAYRGEDAYIRAKELLGLPKNSQVIGNAGWLIPRKRFDILLRVAKGLAQDNPNLIVLIAGSGELEGALQKLAEDLGIGHRVQWLGWQKDLTLFYQALDILVFNSDADSGGMTPLEAMAYGIPVVASVCYGGLGETLVNEKSGFILPEHNVPLMVSYCKQILNNKMFANMIAKSAREAVILRHHPDRIVEFYKKAFNELIFNSKKNKDIY